MMKLPRQSEVRSEEHTSELQSQFHLVCRLLLVKKTGRIPEPAFLALLHPRIDDVPLSPILQNLPQQAIEQEPVLFTDHLLSFFLATRPHLIHTPYPHAALNRH